MRKLKQNTAVDVTIGRARDATTGAVYTSTIAATDVTLSKNDGAFAAKSEGTAPAHKAAGNYTCKLNATDTNTLGILFMAIDHSGVYSWNEIFEVVSAAEWDHVHGSTPQPVNVTAMAANVMTASALAADAVTEIQAGLATAAAVDAVDNFLDTELAAITAALIIRENTAQAGAAGSITLDASASAVTDFYKNQAIVITSGTGVGQIRFVSAYNGTTKVATVNENWATTPDNTSVFKVTSARALDAMLSVAGITDAVLDEPQAGHDTAGTIGWMIRQMHSRMAGKAIKTTTTGDLEFKKIDGTTKDFSHLPTTIDATHVALVPTQGP